MMDLRIEEFPERCQACPVIGRYVVAHQELMKAYADERDMVRKRTFGRSVRFLERQAFSRTGNLCPRGSQDGECGSSAP